MKDKALTRKDFLLKISAPMAALAGITVLSLGCSNGPAKEQQATATKPVTDCDDLSSLTEAERKAREQFGYERQSAVAERNCGNCSLFIIPAKGSTCGGCMLFKGPVRPEGSCIQFAPKPV